MSLLRQIHLVSACLILGFSCAANANEEALFKLINERLSLMKDVAAYKWINEQDIEDQAREAVVIESAISSGLHYEITVDSSRNFFGAQIEAAKAIQQYWFNEWTIRDAPTEAPDLDGVLRPRLIDLGNEITATLSAGDATQRVQFDALMTVEGLTTATKDQLFHALTNIEVYESRLVQILDTGQLRVGTTGDYAPFSAGDTKNSYQGIDIDLAKDLAESLGVRLELVATSWPSLMQDLKKGQYDIAMSGVSRTLERARHGYFSAPYHVGGKTAISLCSTSFDSLEEIDQPGIRLIVNPGGTNERFLDNNIKRATRVLHEDNRTIFDEIIAGRADAMITDEIEVILQSNRHPELCPALPDQRLTYQEKGYLMPQDEPLRQYVNLWLRQRQFDGTFEAVFNRHLR